MSRRIIRKAHWPRKILLENTHDMIGHECLLLFKSFLVRGKKAQLFHKHLLKYQRYEKAGQRSHNETRDTTPRLQ